MDAVEFIKERQRLCQTYVDCFKCPAYNNNTGGCNFNTASGYEAIEQIKLLEEWSAAHPRKTRQDLFLEQWPNAPKDYDGILVLNPCDLDVTIQGKNECYTDNCLKCCHEYWTQEVK